ncbi:tetratricopeptide repeat protein [Methylobacillus sp. Pita2]|uniref:tetratricopeptide repeat protein n=1 Tax=Methylobacillus sp. Pita2 TaxID=3383245 RepID=UPI0038B455B6
MKIKTIFISLLAVCVVACAAPINRKNAENYTRQGAIAMANNDWQTARRAFARAVVNADLGGVAPSTRAVLSYEYGRSLGATCFFDDAAYYLKQAYDLDKQTGGPLYMSLVELARLHLDQGKFAEAATYYQQAIPDLKRHNIPQVGPIGYADTLDEAAIALDAISQKEEASTLRQQAITLRSEHPGQKSITDRTPYGKFCN